jgi:hypothetical protein
MSNAITLPEPDGSAEANQRPHPGGGYEYDEVPAWSEPLVHAHAAAVTAAKDAEIAGLREYLDAAQRRGEELRAQVAALTENGPPMQRGTTIEGTPWMGTMREVLEDYKSAADTEARWGDEARAEVAGLRKALAAAIRQNEHDMLMTGEELRAARAALGDKTPTPPPLSPSPRS